MISSQQSLVFTICGAISRLSDLGVAFGELSGQDDGRKRAICIDCLGAEELECEKFDSDYLLISYEELISFFRPFCCSLSIAFVGPNLNPGFHCKTLGAEKDGIRITFSAYVGLYHDYRSRQNHEVPNSIPDLVVMLNAGLWGYDSWTPTFETFLQLTKENGEPGNNNNGACIFYLATGFTLEEAEDDEDTLRAYFDSRSGQVRVDESKVGSEIASCSTMELKPQWIWESEPSPHVSPI
jgi:hypothetical protein